MLGYSLAVQTPILKCSSTMLARALTVITIFIGALAVLYFLASWTAANGASDLYFPSNLEQLKQVLAELAVIELHKVLPLFCVAYLFKQ